VSRYFIEHQEEVKRSFQFASRVTAAATDFISKLPPSTIKIGVHVRLGDSSGREHVEAKLPQYFKQVFAFYKARHPKAVFVVCSQVYHASYASR
jgi:hypothetical protein